VFALQVSDSDTRWVGAELTCGRVLWTRGRRAHSRPGVAAVGRSRFVVSTARGVELIDASTGDTIRILAPASVDFSAIAAGDVIVEAGTTLHALDPVTGARSWTSAKRGRALSYLELGKHRGLLRTDREISLLDTRAGKVLWHVAAPGRDPLFVAGPRVVIPSVTRTPKGHGLARLQLWRLRDGKALPTRDIARHRRFFDIARVDVLGARGHYLELDTSWIVLD
jgi:outer membrane protein assembly factor BamB